MTTQKRNGEMISLLTPAFVGRNELLDKARRVSVSGVTNTGTVVVYADDNPVEAVLTGIFAVETSGGGVAGGLITATAPLGTFDLYDVGGETLTLSISSGGQVQVARSAGTLVYEVNLWLIWI